MAGPIGIALGAAGLLGLFSTCVDLVDRVGKACSHGNDYYNLALVFWTKAPYNILAETALSPRFATCWVMSW